MVFSLIGSIIGGNKAKKSAKYAADLQYQAAEKGIAETARQYDQTRADFEPFRQSGIGALDNLSDLLGLNGNEVQGTAIDALRNSPFYQSLYDNGENAILANASATGGLRGGNTQRSLYGLGEDTLARTIDRQLSNYGAMVGVGQGATGATANFGANAVAQQNALRNSGASAGAQAALVGGGINARNWVNAGSFLDDIIKKDIGDWF